MNKELAEQVLCILQDCGGLLSHTVWLMKHLASEEEHLKYQRRVAYVYGELLSELVAPIDIEHPDLDPFSSKSSGKQPGQSSEETPQAEKCPDVPEPGDQNS